MIDLKNIGKAFYALCSPFTVPAAAAWIIFSLSILKILVPGAATLYVLTVFGATCVVPLLALIVLQRVGVVQSFFMYRRSERILPYCLQIVALGAVALFLVYKGANAWIWTVFCGGAAIGVVNLIINFFMRISSCCSSMAALLAVLMVVNADGMPQYSLIWWVIGAVALAGVTGSLAISVARHSVWEVLAGYATGFVGIILFNLIK